MGRAPRARRLWKPHLSDEVRRACKAGVFQLNVYGCAPRAFLNVVSRGTKSPWMCLKDADGWTYYKQLNGFVAFGFASDASALDLVSVGIIDLVRTGTRYVLINGFMDIQRCVDDILHKVAVFVAGEWRLDTQHVEQFGRANGKIVARLRQKAAVVAEERRLREKKAEEKEQRREEDEKREEARCQRYEAAMDVKFEALLSKVHTTRFDTREQAQYNHRLRCIGDFMRDKPASFFDWTPEMLRESERSNVQLTLSKEGGESWVDAVYPDPPES